MKNNQNPASLSKRAIALLRRKPIILYFIGIFIASLSKAAVFKDSVFQYILLAIALLSVVLATVFYFRD
jgi:hypothetical protein